jgi:vacuolar-type H+-ATPase subunit H
VSLDPLRHALRTETGITVGERLAAVDTDCSSILAEAEAQARQLVQEGRREGEQMAAKEALRRRATATRRAREIRLQAQLRQVDELRRRSQEAILRLREDDRYPDLLHRLSSAAVDQLGPAAELEVDPPGVGGVIGRSGRKSVDYTLPAVVDRVVASLDEELENLWR